MLRDINVTPISLEEAGCVGLVIFPHEFPFRIGPVPQSRVPSRPLTRVSHVVNQTGFWDAGISQEGVQGHQEPSGLAFLVKAQAVEDRSQGSPRSDS